MLHLFTSLITGRVCPGLLRFRPLFLVHQTLCSRLQSYLRGKGSPPSPVPPVPQLQPNHHHERGGRRGRLRRQFHGPPRRVAVRAGGGLLELLCQLELPSPGSRSVLPGGAVDLPAGTRLLALPAAVGVVIGGGERQEEKGASLPAMVLAGAGQAGGHGRAGGRRRVGPRLRASGLKRCYCSSL